MGRPKRVHFPGALFHVMSRGNGGRMIFKDAHDYRVFLKILGSAKSQLGLELLAYCLMPNHFHLLAKVDKIPLSRIMQQVLTRYATWFNWRWNRRGHVFQSRYKALLCEKDSYLAVVVRYIHLNPVKASLVKTPSQWPWSSHAHYLSEIKDFVDPTLPLSLFGSSSVAAQKGYREFLDNSSEDAAPPNFRIMPAAPRQTAPPRVTLERLAHLTCRKMKVPLGMLTGRSTIRVVVKARHAFIFAAIEAGHRPCEIAALLRLTATGISRVIGKKFRQSMSDTSVSSAGAGFAEA